MAVHPCAEFFKKKQMTQARYTSWAQMREETLVTTRKDQMLRAE